MWKDIVTFVISIGILVGVIACVGLAVEYLPSAWRWCRGHFARGWSWLRENPRPGGKVALMLLVMAGVAFFLTYGIDEDDIVRGIGSPDGAFVITLPTQSAGQLVVNATVRRQSSLPSFAELRSELRIEGRVGLCAVDADAETTRSGCVGVCDEGVVVRKTRWHVESVTLAPECTLPDRWGAVRTRAALLDFATRYVTSARGKASIRSGIPGSYAALSHAAVQNSRVIAAMQSVVGAPSDIRLWLRLAFFDLRSISTIELIRNLPTYADYEWEDAAASIRPLFRFSRDGRTAKFGVKKYEIDRYGDQVGETVVYEVVEAQLNETGTDWTLLTVDPTQGISVDLDVALEAGLAVRLGGYLLACFAVLIAAARLLRGGKRTADKTKKENTPEASAGGNDRNSPSNEDQ